MTTLSRCLIPLILIVILASAGCQRQQELCFDHDRHERIPMDVEFDWSDHPDADPATMSLYLFPEDGRPSIRYEFEGRDGGRILVPAGRYTAIALNSDTEEILVEETDRLETFRVRLRDANELQGLSMRSSEVPRAPGAEGERMAYAPTKLWRVRTDGLFADEGTEEVQKFRLRPTDVLCRYSVRIDSVANIGDVQSVSATLSGMAGGMLFHDGTLTGEIVTIPLEITPSEGVSLSGTWMSLGHCGHSRCRTDGDSPQEKHIFTVYAVLADGSRWYHNYTVTEQMHATDSGECEIILDRLELPKAMSGGGFNISIGEWQTITQLIPM